MNATMYDASRLVAQLAHRAQYGFWATPEQLRMALESGVLEAPEVDLADLAQPQPGMGTPGTPVRDGHPNPEHGPYGPKL